MRWVSRVQTQASGTEDLVRMVLPLLPKSRRTLGTLGTTYPEESKTHRPTRYATISIIPSSRFCAIRLSRSTSFYDMPSFAIGRNSSNSETLQLFA